jgi:exodeoxyribonuclease-5
MITLNLQQKNASTAMLKFTNQNTQRYFVLSGQAGTGKTTTIQHFMAKCPLPEDKICLTAPTNKAVSVLGSFARDHNISVTCCTIHSLLGLTIKLENGREILTDEGHSTFKNYRLVVIDEMGMIDSQLMRYIESEVYSSGTKVILMGDPYQLPPVGEAMSMSFGKAKNTELTQVMRQREENPILGLCTDIRRKIENKDFTWPKINPQLSDDKSIGVHVLGIDDFEQQLIDTFAHDNFNSDINVAKAIAWRNKSVNYYNGLIQLSRYPDITKPFAIGEPVVFSKPLCKISNVPMFKLSDHHDKSWNDILCKTECEAIVTSITDIEPFVFSPTPKQIKDRMSFDPFTIPQCRITVETDQGTKMSCVVTTDEHKLDALLKFIVAKIKEQKGVTWYTYYLVRKYFSELRASYAITSHKSQGSTYKDTFVDIKDIMANPNKEEALRCLYVAISRTSHNLYIKN